MTRARRGSILIVVMFVMTVVSLLAVSFAYVTSLRSRGVRDSAIRVRVSAQAKSAVAIAMARISANEAEFDHLAQSWSMHGPLGADGWLDEWSADRGQRDSDYVADYQVIDEEGKLNIAYASDQMLEKLG